MACELSLNKAVKRIKGVVIPFIAEKLFSTGKPDTDRHCGLSGKWIVSHILEIHSLKHNQIHSCKNEDREPCLFPC